MLSGAVRSHKHARMWQITDLQARVDYELVRVHHPDSPAARDVPSDVAQARFHSITAAYDALRGGTTGAFSPERARAEARDLNAAIWRAKQARKADLNVDVVDDQWKDRIIIGFVLVVGCS
jgi:hypothetical protein